MKRIIESRFPIEVKSGPSGKLKSLHQYFLSHATKAYGLAFHDGLASAEPDKGIFYRPLYGRF